MKKYLNKLKKDTFFEAFNLVMAKPRLYFTNLGLDLGFLLLVYIFGTIGNVFVPYVIGLNNMFALFLALIIYILLIVLVYSFTKHLALHFVRNMLGKAKLDLGKVKDFYLFNLLSFLVFLAVLAFVSKVVVGGVRENLLKWTSRTVITLFSLVLFSFIGMAHSLFTLGSGVKDSFKKGFKLVFTRLNKYYPVFLVNAAVFAVYTGIYYILSKLVGFFFTVNIERFEWFFAIVAIALIYIMQVYNRVYFYLVVKHIKK